MGFVRKVGRAIDDIFIQPIKEVVEDIGSGIDDLVHDIIPGGWAGVAGLGLLAAGVYNPTLFGLAEGGALTSEAVAAAGLDAAATAEAVASVAPEVLAATEAAVSSGIAPEIIAMANATADPIAALSAAQGFTVADTAYLASIGAPEALIATATANNAALAAAGETAATTGAAAETGATTGATTGAETTAGTTTAADGSTTQIFDDGSTLTTAADGTVSSTPATGGTAGSTTQVFDDGSTLTTNADGTISATDTAGNPTQTLVSPGGPGQAPVYDASGTAVPGTNNPYGTGDIPLGTATKDLVKGIYDTLGPLGTAGLVGGGLALASGALSPSNLGSQVGSGSVNYPWGEGIPIQTGPLNPGLLQQAASQPFYKSTNPTDAQYYWGAHPVINKPEDIANYNNIPSAPATPWGAGKTAVGGTAQFDPVAFTNQYITNPAYAGIMSGTGPGYTPVAPIPPEPMSIPVAQPLSMAQQAIAARSGAPTAQLTAGPAVPA